jgi:hypothetical protein
VKNEDKTAGGLMQLFCFGLCTISAWPTRKLLSNAALRRRRLRGPDGWYTSAYRTQEGYTRFEITDEQAHSAAKARRSPTPTNDAR